MINGMRDSLLVDARKVTEDPLVGIGKADHSGHLTQGLDHPPLVDVRILELVDDDQRVGPAVQRPEGPAPFEQQRGGLGQEIEGEQPVFLCQPSSLLLPVAVEVGASLRFSIGGDEGGGKSGQESAVTANDLEEESMEGSKDEVRAAAGIEDVSHAVGNLPNRGP